LKRTVCTAITALNNSDVKQPDAIITGTGMGCMENSEKFLIDLSRFGEQCLKPTLFMQSTHNTISSLIAIILKCHGYNNTYSHKGISFESSLFDAWIQIKSGMIRNALVGAHDEVTPFMDLVMERTHPEYSLVSESSVSTIITNAESKRNICEISEVKLFHRPDYAELANMLSPEEDGIILSGINGNPMNDEPYNKLIETLSYTPRILQYKNIFGDNFSASALAFYAAATILNRQGIPVQMVYGINRVPEIDEIKGITILNHSDGTTWSLIRLKKV
ncbi:MAG: hypothetical protein K2K08_00090, partial [Paramuribaculum sp.]|nr:hypothetical protein [Paramuribaculum sp.]